LIEPGVILTPIVEKFDQPDPASPYARFNRRMARYFVGRLKQPAMPDLVADAIYHALTTDDPKLRYLVGPDAQVLIPGRQSVSDEEWIALGQEMSDEEVDKAFMDLFGLDMATAQEAGVDMLPEG
jgi:hypothetical protein